MTMTDFNLWTWNSRAFPGHRSSGRAQGRPRAHPDGQSHHDQPSDPPARPPLRGDLHRRRLGAGERALARGHDRYSGRRHARHRIRRRRAGRLGDPLPQVAPHHERHGPQREDLHRRAEARSRAGDPQARRPTTWPMGSRGMAEMGEMEMPMPDNTLPMMTGFGQFGPLEMGGMFSVREGARRACRQRLQGPRLVQASAGNRRLRGHRRDRTRCAAAQRSAERSAAGRSSTSSSRASIPAPTIISEKEANRHESLCNFCGNRRAAWRRRAGRGGNSVAMSPPAHTKLTRRFSAGEPGNPKQPARVVMVTMKEGDGKMSYVARPDRGPQG